MNMVRPYPLARFVAGCARHVERFFPQKRFCRFEIDSVELKRRLKALVIETPEGTKFRDPQPTVYCCKMQQNISSQVFRMSSGRDIQSI